MRILFIHGRDQQDFTQEELLTAWTALFKESFDRAELTYPNKLNISMPFYGKELVSLRDIYLRDIKDGKYQMRSTGTSTERMQEFQEKLLNDLRKNAGITEKQIHEEMQAQMQKRSARNFGPFLAIVRIFDNLGKDLGNSCVLKKTDDVVTYLIVPDAKEKINKFFTAGLTKEPTVIIAHSLGTVIAYDILHQMKVDNYDIRGLITLGSPLGINAIIRQLNPSPTFPPILNGPWINIYDKHDIVSLRPLQGGSFWVNPKITNYDVDNNTKHKHSIEGYLNHPLVANAIYQILND